MTKSLLNESLADCSRTGLNPFCALNKPPAADLPFWSKKLQDKSAKKTRMNNKALEKPAKKKTNPFELFDLDDKDESEVKLYSLGSFFVHLIDNDHYQDDAEGSRANVEEVTILSSDSETPIRQKGQQASRKVRFSHPLAYLDPNFILKKQQHEARRMTSNIGGGILSSDLPNTPAPCKRRPEGTSHSSSGDSTGTQVPLFEDCAWRYG
ncbi:uncharacterized protein [Triticum aestivum]|uniref:uncharacterized protein isoform X1 n=1 Tax=Triticum aestivum TaxID=4565 RepID=UPI001D00B998|nr:uncharacterized protein LOC123104442 isoform X1 [Triticum aestivum]